MRRQGTTPLLIMIIGACGGSAEDAAPRRAVPQATAGREQAAPPEDGLEVQGLRGTLSSSEIHSTLNPRLPRFAGCFSSRYEQLDLIGGHFGFAFHVAPDGQVQSVFPETSSVGDRLTERCLLEVAADTRFPPPHGGQAEFSWSLSFDPPQDVRPPVLWNPSHVSEVVDEHADTLDDCGGRRLEVTVYVRPGGAVMAAGAATAGQPSADMLDCVAAAVEQWPMPDPGSYPAKVSFRVR